MKLHELSPAPGSVTPAWRKGRGTRSGNGKTSGDVLHSLMMERVGHDLIRPHQLPDDAALF